MANKRYVLAGTTGLGIAIGVGLVSMEPVAGPAKPEKRLVAPTFKVDPFWPKPLPDNVVNSWGNPTLEPAGALGPSAQSIAGQNAVLPNGTHGCFVDYQDNVWIGGNGDGVVQKYSHDGTLLLQIGVKFECDDGLGTPGTPGNFISCTGAGGGNVMRTGGSSKYLSLPADIAVDPNPDPRTGQRGSVYVADGYGNHRVVVFDKDGNY